MAADEVVWETIVESANDALLTTNTAGIITFANSRAAVLFGLERDDLHGRSVAELIPGADHLLGNYRDVPEEHVELYGIRPNDGEFSLELSVAHFDARGTSGFVVVVRDTTKHARVAKLLAKREMQLAELTAQSSVEHDRGRRTPRPR